MLPDVQKSKDHIQIPINKVGVKNVKMPFIIKTKQGSHQSTVGFFSLYVNLAADQKGTHMSRFIIELQRYIDTVINYYSLQQLSEQLCHVLESNQSYINVDFDYFLMKESPVTKIYGMIDYKCRFDIMHDKEDNSNNYFDLTVNVPVTSLCPCSKEISDFGAHNQRSNVTVTVRIDPTNPYVWIEDLINVIEHSASCEIFSILKREDEKWVTEQAYQNPVFCEDIVRNIADKLQQFNNILKYHIISENHESIHNHIASAEICSDS